MKLSSKYPGSIVRIDSIVNSRKYQVLLDQNLSLL